MFETLAAVGIAAGFVLLLRLIAGPDGDESTILRMFVSAPMPARPRGVQETDLAPFAFPDADRCPRLQTGSAPSSLAWIRREPPEP